jgi:hypothetical protein
MFLGEINTGIWPFRLRVPEIETIKYGNESRGTQTRERMAGDAQQQLKIADPTSRQRGRATPTNP